MKNTPPQLIVQPVRPGFGATDALVLLAVFGLLWSALHFGRGMVVAFDGSNAQLLDFSTS